ncbi:MAG: type III restriction endonuclease subunit R, partial [Xanthomonadales bacterium]|nr:type III restriction endonuclease subunit R [Xanthomonadales bacterium]
FTPRAMTATTVLAGAETEAAFSDPGEQHIAQAAYAAIRALARQPQTLPMLNVLQHADIQAQIVAAVEQQCTPAQMQLAGMNKKADVAAVVAKTIELVTRQTIDIPRILVVPKGDVTSGFHPFKLDLSALKYPPVSEDLWVQHLRTGQRDVVALSGGGAEESRLEDYVVSGLVAFDDVSYDENADLLYELAEQVVEHFKGYLAQDDVGKVLRCYQKGIAKLVHAQMEKHYFEHADDYEVQVRRGFTELKDSAYTQGINEQPADYRVVPQDKSNMGKYLFGGFRRCLYAVQKFDSDAERKLAVILEREALKWFRPARGQFELFYRDNGDPKEYQPDFVAETEKVIYMLEPKRRSELDDAVVLAKKDVAEQWCANAAEHAREYGGKPWRYALIPHDAIAENMTLAGLVERFASRVPVLKGTESDG